MKKANKKSVKKIPVQQFPRISRIIPETLKSQKDSLFIMSGVLFMLLAIIVVGDELYRNNKEKNRIDSDKKRITNELAFWEKTIKTYPDFRDAYYSLAILEYRFKNFEKSKYYLERTLEIDPNFKEGIEFQKTLDR